MKYWAALSMLVGHLAILLFPAGSLLWILGSSIGQLSFPVFAWCAAEGFSHTGDRKKYLLRLGLFALISEVPYLLFFSVTGGCSALATFFLAIGSISLFVRWKEELPLPTALLPFLAAMLLGQLLHCSYGFMGVLLPGGLILCGENRRGKLLFTGAWCILEHLIVSPLPKLLSLLPAGIWTPNLVGVIEGYILQNLPVYACFALFSVLSLLLLSRYHGERGAGQKWFFYWFYPLHLLCLAILRGFSL